MSGNIINEPHPVSAERKAELRAKGYRILDVKFKPDNQPAVTNETEVLGAKKDDQEDFSLEAEEDSQPVRRGRRGRRALPE